MFNPSAPRVNASKNEPGATADQNEGKANTESLAESLRSFSVDANDSKIAFLKPRGLVNTGNMCYMNSVSCFFHMVEHKNILMLPRFFKFLFRVFLSTLSWIR